MILQQPRASQSDMWMNVTEHWICHKKASLYFCRLTSNFPHETFYFYLWLTWTWIPTQTSVELLLIYFWSTSSLRVCVTTRISAVSTPTFLVHTTKGMSVSHTKIANWGIIDNFKKQLQFIYSIIRYDLSFFFNPRKPFLLPLPVLLELIMLTTEGVGDSDRLTDEGLTLYRIRQTGH